MTSTALDINHHGAAATALAIQPGQNSWDRTQLAALGQLGLEDAGDGDRAVFLHVCQRTGLDPFARQIYMIGRNEKVPGTRDQWRKKWTIQTGIDGFRVNRGRAEKREGVRGTLGRAIFYDHEGNEYKVWVQPRPPAACEITYTVRDIAGNETPYTSVLRFAEYVQVKDGNPIAQWASKPAHMLEKCTEADVYRKAFPQDFSGIYLDDTLPPQQDAPPAPPRGRVTAGEIISRQEPAAEDDTLPGSGRAVAGNETRAAAGEVRTQTDPRAAGAASPRGAQPPPPQPEDEPKPARATTGQLSMLGQRLGRLGVDDENRLSTLAKLSGHDDLGKAGDLTQDEAAHIRGLLDRCNGDRGALVELLATGQLPEAEKAGGGDE
jgi:phage recombination protein Bet